MSLRIEIHGARAEGKSTFAAFLEKIINRSHTHYRVSDVQDDCTLSTQQLRDEMHMLESRTIEIVVCETCSHLGQLDKICSDVETCQPA